jgi:Predicted nucleotide-binding protein containing TIR-like domain
MKPSLFIGSSSEKLLYAFALQDQLKSSADVTLWSQGFFSLNTSYLESLINGLNDSDFGVFVFAPDDILTLRNETLASIRDNVLFEFGLSMGKLGRERVFFILPENQGNLRLPSDLLGISTVTFDTNRGNIEAALGPACFKILQAIDKFGVRQERLVPPMIEIIKAPKVLCACSPQYFHLSFQKDVELIKRETQKIAAQISELHSTDSEGLTKALMDNQFDIVHISAYVDPKTGEIYFNDIGSDGVPPIGVIIDSMPAVSFSRLIEMAKVKLVVLATCDSLILAAKLAKVTNMVAATDWVYVDDILKWELGLYKCISKGISLSNAYETASSLSKAPMLLLLKKDLAFIG